MHRNSPRSESGFRRRPSYNQESDFRDRNRPDNRFQNRRYQSPERDWQNRSQRHHSRDQNQSYQSHKSYYFNPDRRYPYQRYESNDQTRRYHNQRQRSPPFSYKRSYQDPKYLNVNGFYDRVTETFGKSQNNNCDQTHHQDHRIVAKLEFTEVKKDEADEKNLRPKRLRERDINNRVVTESTLARPIPPTPRFDQRRDQIVWSKAAFIIGSNSSLPSCDLPSKPLTSSPVTVQGEGSGVPSFDLSVITGPNQRKEETLTQKSGQELRDESNELAAKMPRIVTLERKRENGKKDPRPSDDLENVSEEDGEISDSSDDDIILLEDNGNEVKVSTNRKDDNGSHKSSKEPEELCEFHRNTVTTHDYKTLADEEFLNDAIVNFYLTYLYEQLSEPLKEAIHIFSSHFYSRLKGDSKSRKSGNNPAKTQAEKSYDRVKSWTRKIDIFAKRMLIYPICEESHWYTVIVCNPGMVLSAKRTENYEEKREAQQKLEPQGANPFIMVLDSLGGSHSSAVGKIRSYLQFEHLERKKMPLNFGREKMNEKHPPIPQQPNSCDCGVFLLHYVELIFRDPPKFLGAKLPDLSQWFSSKEIDFKREDIALLIKRLSKEQKAEKIKFPSIKFPARRPKTASPVDEEPASTARDSTSSRISDPRLRRYVPQPSDVIVRQIRITKNPVVTGNEDDGSSSVAIKGPRPSRFSSSPRRSSDNGKRSFEEWSRNSKFSTEVVPRKLPVCTVETSTPRSSSRVVERSSRDQTRNDASDNNLLFGVGPAESAKRRKTSSSSWRVVGSLKEEVMPDDRQSNDDHSKKRRFVLNRDAIEPASRSKEIRTSREMFDALMKDYPKKKKS